MNKSANWSAFNSVRSFFAISEFRNHKSLIAISIVSDKFSTFFIVFFQSLKSVEKTLSRFIFLIKSLFSVGSSFKVSNMNALKKTLIFISVFGGSGFFFQLKSFIDYGFLKLLTTVLAYEKLRVKMRKLVGVNLIFFKCNKFRANTGAAIFYMQC